MYLGRRLKIYLRELANIILLEINIMWNRPILYFNFLLLILLTLACYPSGPLPCYSLSPKLDPWDMLFYIGLALHKSSVGLTALLVVVSVLSWAGSIRRGWVKNILTLPVGRRTLFIAKMISVSLIPYLTFSLTHIFAQIYLFHYIYVPSLLLIMFLVALHVLYVFSISTLTSLLIKDIVGSLLLSLAILMLPSWEELPPEFSHFKPEECYLSTFKFISLYMYSHNRKRIYLAFIKSISDILALLIVSIIASIFAYFYFKKMDID